MIESVEPRFLLSTTTRTLLGSPAILDARGTTPAHVSIQPADHAGSGVAEVRIRKGMATQLSGVSATGLQGGSTTLSVTLTSAGSPLAGRKVRFVIRGRNVGKATTDANGVATLTVARVKGLKAGVYARGATAVFAGGAGYKGSTVRAALTVSRFATSLGGVSAAGVYGGDAVLTASLTSNGSPVSGQTIRFQLDGHDVGQAVTGAQGVATLGGVSLAGLNAGAYTGAVTASFVGGATYQGAQAGGNLTVHQAQVNITLGDLTQTYSGTARAVSVTTSPSGAAYSVVYTDASGNPVASPVNAAVYNVRVTVTDPNDAGSATGQLVINPAPLNVGGITASGKVYDGTTAATIDVGGAMLSGVVNGDNVTLNTSAATGAFDSKDVGSGKVVTISGLTLGGATAGNYVLVPAMATATITAAPLTVTGLAANDKVYDGTSAATLNASSGTLVGVIPGDAVTPNFSGASGTFDSKDVGTNRTVTVSGLTLSGADAGNYSLSQPTTTADISAAPLTVTGITASNKTYDGTTAATLNTALATLVGLIPGDSVTLSTSSASGTFASASAGAGKTVTISGLTLGGSDAGNYVLTQPTTTANIAAATLSVSGITASGKVYDGTTAATIDTGGATLSGALPGDDVTLNTAGATGSFDTKDVGNGKTVTVSGLALTGTDAGNYVIGPVTTTADITAATLSVSGITAGNKPYDGTDTATLDASGAALVDVVPGDDVTLDASAASGSFDSPDIGTGKTVTVSGLTLTGADAGDYVLTQPTTTADITLGILTVSGITASGKVYDGSTDATIDASGATLSGVVAGDDVSLDTSGASGSFDTKDVGNGKTVTITGLVLTGADADKYELAPVTTTADITAATLTVSGITASGKVYDGSTTADIDTSGAGLSGAMPGDDVSLDTSAATGSFDTKDVGSGKTVTVSGLTLTGADAGNYVISPVTTTADITAATLTVSGITASGKVYDGTTDASIDTSGATLSGAVDGDDVALDATSASGTFDTKDVGTGKTVTITGLALTGTDAGDYVLSSVSTSADITPAALTVSGITASDKVYDGTTAASIDTSGASLSGVVAGDDVALDVSAATGTFDTRDVGSGKTVTVSGLALTGTDAGDYLIAPVTISANVTPATLSVSGITASGKVYDGTTDATIDASGATLSGAVTGDDVALDTSAATGSFDTKDVGSGKTVTISGLVLTGADAGDYIVALTTTSADVTPATLTVTGITASDKVYDGTTAASIDTTGATLAGVIGGDDATLDATNAVGTFDTPDVGTDKTVTITGLVLTGADAGDYTLVDPTTTASITAS